MAILRRHIARAILASLKDSPVVFIQGARQTGKSTLAQSLSALGHSSRYLTLDDAATLAAAQSDPQGFVAGLEGPVILDEVQRAPGLALAIKASVDENRTPGRFLLTGSANVLLLPRLSESLAGRIEIHTLWPLSQGELAGSRENFIDAVFQDRFAPEKVKGEGWPKLAARLVRGGYPEMLRRIDAPRRRAWFGSYITTLLQRDVRDIANVRDLSDLPRLLTLMASRAGGLLDYADLSRGLSMPQSTLKRYTGLLEATFLVQTLPAWFANIGKRLVKSPKLLVNDAGLLVHLLGADIERLKADPTLGGAVLENFVAMELLKERGWSDLQPGLFHFRTHNGEEVDLVLEDPAGRIVGIEVKATATLNAGHFKGLKALAETAGDRMVRGIVLYGGNTAVNFAKNLLALPMPNLWATFAD
ncbi:MAG: ATP-binding protein [Tepidisphaeraceae bacterium]|jgi:predicted AAA+ superfamily ATPase